MKYKEPNVPSHGHLRGDNRTWRRVLTAGAIRGMGGNGGSI